jgi:two-component system sensor histidine kinase BaeS
VDTALLHSSLVRGTHFGLRARLFLALLTVTLVAIAVSGIAERVSFVRGFLGYLNQQESEHIQSVLPRLVTAYEQYGGWWFLRRDPMAWISLLNGDLPHLPPDPFVHGEIFDDSGLAREPPPPPPFAPIFSRESDLTGMNQRVALLDESRHPVAGNPRIISSALTRPVVSHGKVVGWLAIVPLQSAMTGAAQRLERQQLQVTWIIALGAIGLTALAAALLSRRLVQPIREIAGATHQLAAGRYHTRLKVSSQDEIGELAEDFNRLALALERNEMMRRAFMADVSHELRTPLAILRGEIEALQDGVRSLSVERLDSLQCEVSTMSRLVYDIYELSLADVGALNYRMEPLDLAVLLRAKACTFRERMAGRELTLETDIPECQVSITADERRIQQLLNNLLENSLRYTNPGGRVSLSCQPRRSQVTIDLQDTAPGVPPQMLTRLFDRFYRVEASRNRDSGGAGLGLAICKSIVEAHNGSISARPSTLGGLWISVTLPRTR